MRHVFLTAAVLSAAGLLALPSPSRGEDRRAREKREQRQREETRRREEERLRAEQIRLGLYPTSQPTSQPSTYPSTYSPPPPAPRQPAAGAGQQGDRRTAAQKMQDVLRQQEMVKRAMREQVMNQANAQGNGPANAAPAPLTPAEEVAEAQRKLDEETARHDNRLTQLRREEAGAKAAGDKKRAQRARKDIEAENEAYSLTVAGLRRQLRESQARLDAEVSR